MSKSFRHSPVSGGAKPLRGFYKGRIQRMKKSRRYKIKACVDEEGTPILPAHISKSWPENTNFGGSKWWNEELPPYMIVHRPGRKFLSYEPHGISRWEQKGEMFIRFK